MIGDSGQWLPEFSEWDWMVTMMCKVMMLCSVINSVRLAMRFEVIK